jgi:hypothetical protein
VDVDHARRVRLREAERLALLVVVLEHERRDRVRHLDEQLVALLLGQVARLDHRVQQDLDVDLAVRAVDTAGVVDRVRVDPAARQRVLDPPALRDAEVAALADHLRAQLGAVDAHAVVGLVAGVGVRLRLGLHVGADAAVPEQVDRRAEQRMHELGGLERLVLDSERLASLR